MGAFVLAGSAAAAAPISSADWASKEPRAALGPQRGSLAGQAPWRTSCSRRSLALGSTASAAGTTALERETGWLAGRVTAMPGQRAASRQAFLPLSTADSELAKPGRRAA